MGAWNTIFEDEVEGRLVTIRVYESDEPEDQDDAPAVRVIARSLDDYGGAFESVEGGQTFVLAPEASGRTITLEPYSFEDLEGELIEVGFRPEAAMSIVSKIPV